MILLQKNLTKLCAYFILSFVFAAILTPHLYAWGKQLAVHTANHDCSAAIEWLGVKCERAHFARYFKRALMLSALLLIYPLLKVLKRVDEVEVKPRLRSRIKPDRHAVRDIIVGFSLSSVFFFLLGFVAWQLGYMHFQNDFTLGKFILKALPAALFIALIEEWLFRSFLFRLLRREMKVKWAIVWLTLIYVVVHFAQPPKGIYVENPTSSMAGFEFLARGGQSLFSAEHWGESVGTLMTLGVIGVILAIVVYRTGNLWAAIGLHAGWVVMDKLFTSHFEMYKDRYDLYLFGENIKLGIVPVAFLAITGVSVILYLRKYHAKNSIQSFT